MKNYKFYFLALLLVLFVASLAFKYFDYVENKRESYQAAVYHSEALKMKKGVLELIDAKERATVAIALSLAKDSALEAYILAQDIPLHYYDKIITSYRDNTHYKNIWIQVLDKDLNSLYRSWTTKRNDNLYDVRKDLQSARASKKVTVGISSGKYDLSMSAIVPIMYKGELLGLLEVTSHFNSIATQVKHFNIDSIVLLDVNGTKKLEEPFTKTFLDNHYVANLNAPEEMLEYIKEQGVTKYVKSTSPYEVENGYLITSLELRCVHGKEVGDYIMFKKLSDISTTSVEFLFFKQLTFGVILLLLVMGVISLIMFYYIRKQKLYYKDIIDSSHDIILINQEERIIDVNDAFFQYFENYDSLQGFKKEHNCICDFFEDEEGYLQERVDGKYWIDYLLEKEQNSSVVKIKIGAKEYYFKVSASTILESHTQYSIVFSDITQQENYKHSLEKLTITDSLTGIGNRRYFEQKLEEEIARVKRYGNSLSLIMFDIDHFKKVNDTYGHEMGDNVLIEYTALIASHLRAQDVFCRVGGEEFIVILPNTDVASAYALAEKLRNAVECFAYKIAITMSFGVVEYTENETSNEVYIRVDRALYEAKNSGRNRVVVG